MFLTKFYDAYFLQIFPGNVCDEVDVLVAILHQNLVVLAQTYGRQPLPKVVLQEDQKNVCLLFSAMSIVLDQTVLFSCSALQSHPHQ